MYRREKKIADAVANFGEQFLNLVRQWGQNTPWPTYAEARTELDINHPDRPNATRHDFEVATDQLATSFEQIVRRIYYRDATILIKDRHHRFLLLSSYKTKPIRLDKALAVVILDELKEILFDYFEYTRQAEIEVDAIKEINRFAGLVSDAYPF